MEEKLIEAVKMHPGLYDKSSSVFRNKCLKDRAWQAVAAAAGVPEDHCKGRWKSLRDRFVRELSTSKMKPGKTAEEKVQWTYMESMRFLTKHVSPRKTSSSFQWNISTDEEPSCSQTSPMPQDEGAVEKDYLEDSQDTSSSSGSSKSQRNLSESRERFDRLCGTIESVITAKTEKTPSRNAAFLQLLDEYLQKKPEEVQDRLKIELLTYVHNAK